MSAVRRDGAARRGLLLGLGLALCGAAGAADVALQTPLQDPWVPPAVQAKALRAAPAPELTLQMQVEKKLRAAFDAADAARTGTLSVEEARAAGLGIVANNFRQIDTAGTGRVSFDDFRRYLRARGAVY